MFNVLTISSAAKQKIRALIEAQGKPGDGLRVAIAGRSAAGFRYSLSFVEGGEPDSEEDVVFDGGGFPVIIEAESAPYLEGVIIDYVEEGPQRGFRIGNPNPIWNDPKALRLQEVLEGQVNPILATHGGHVDLVDFRDGEVYLRFSGGCQGCSMVLVTLQESIEKSIREALPEVREIVDVTDHAAGTNPYYPPSPG